MILKSKWLHDTCAILRRQSPLLSAVTCPPEHLHGFLQSIGEYFGGDIRRVLCDAPTQTCLLPQNECYIQLFFAGGRAGQLFDLCTVQPVLGGTIPPMRCVVLKESCKRIDAKIFFVVAGPRTRFCIRAGKGVWRVVRSTPYLKTVDYFGGYGGPLMSSEETV